MKYVCFELSGENPGPRIPFLFPDMISHSDIVRAWTAQYPGYVAVSGGFASWSGNAWGKSITAGLKSDVEDSGYIKRLLEVEQ